MQNDLLVIKLGTGCTIKNGSVDFDIIRRIGRQILELREKKNLRSILVVSGSIGLGMRILGYEERPREKIILQRCAGVGQIELMKVYSTGFSEFGLIASQYLLTYHNFVSGEEKENLKKNIKDDVLQGIVPIINYNDKVDWQEITRNNDKLSANVALLNNASLLLILTDSVEGLIVDGNLIKEVKINEIDGYKRLCNDISKYGTGGFEAKLDAAKIVVPSGIKCVIGNVNYRIEDLLEGSVPRTIIQK